MLSILGLIPTVLTFITGLGGTASSISKDLRDREIAKTQALNNKEVKQIEAEVQIINARKDVLVAEAGNRINGIIRAVIALLPVPYLAKYWLWDKTIGAFRGCAGDAGQILTYCATHRTDGLNTEMAAILTAIIAFFFLATMRK